MKIFRKSRKRFHSVFTFIFILVVLIPLSGCGQPNSTKVNLSDIPVPTEFTIYEGSQELLFDPFL